MRLLYWSELFWPHIGGLEVYGEQLLPALRERGYEVAVVTSRVPRGLPGRAEYCGIPIHRFPFHHAMGAHDLGAVLTVQRQVAALRRAFAPDVVQLNFSGPNLISFFNQRTAAAHPAPTLAVIHDLTAAVGGGNGLSGQVLRAADWVVAVSAAMLGDLRQLLPETAAYSSVIHNGLPLPTLAPTPLPFVAPRLLCLGRVVPEKGFDLAVSAFATVLRRFPEARLVVAGDGTARAGLEEQAARLGLGDAVEFLGWVPPERVPELINAATCVVMPSRWREPFGLVAVQGAQLARPVVASRVGGLPEIVADGETGLLVERDDSAALAEAMIALLERPALAVRLGEAARTRALERFSLDSFVDAYDARYRELVRSGGRAVG